MKAKELRQIYYLNKELKMWQEELDNLQRKSLIKGQEITGMPFVSGTSDRVGDTATALYEMEMTIRAKLAKIQLERKKIMEYINLIDDSYMRQVIFLRNVSCMGWEQIADELGGSSDAHRKAYRRFLEKK